MSHENNNNEMNFTTRLIVIVHCETNTHLFLCHLIDINMLDNTTSTSNNGYQISRHVNDGVKKQDISISVVV